MVQGSGQGSGLGMGGGEGQGCVGVSDRAGFGFQVADKWQVTCGETAVL